MAERVRIGLKEVKGLKPGQTIWDETVRGFGARRQKGTAVTYQVIYRTSDGRQRWHTIGTHGAPWTPDKARDEAKAALGLVVKGADPAGEKQAARKAETVLELCDLYLKDAKAGRLLTRRRHPKKPSTLVTDEVRITRHIKPLLGNRKVAAVRREDIEGFSTRSQRVRRRWQRMPKVARALGRVGGWGPRAAPWHCSARFSLTLSSIGCAPTIRCAVQRCRLTASAIAALAMTSTLLLGQHYVRQKQTMSGQHQLRLLAS
jgi:hypothetical protein